MMDYVLKNSLSKDSVGSVHNNKTDKVAGDMLARQKDFLRQKLEQDEMSQIEWQNAQPIHTAFRLNGKLVGTIGVNTGFTSSGIPGGPCRVAYAKANAMADEKGVYGEARNDFVNKQVGDMLKESFGASFEAITYDPDDRPTSGELDAEMFGHPYEAPEKPEPTENEFAYMKVFAQMYAQKFGEDPFEGIDVPF